MLHSFFRRSNTFLNSQLAQVVAIGWTGHLGCLRSLFLLIARYTTILVWFADARGQAVFDHFLSAVAHLYLLTILFEKFLVSDIFTLQILLHHCLPLFVKFSVEAAFEWIRCLDQFMLMLLHEGLLVRCIKFEEFLLFGVVQ